MRLACESVGITRSGEYTIPSISVADGKATPTALFLSKLLIAMTPTRIGSARRRSERACSDERSGRLAKSQRKKMRRIIAQAVVYRFANVSPLLGQEGWLRIKKMLRSHL